MLLPNENILKAISWTLLHSMWQGLILAILAGLVILFTKKAKANLRYSILSGLFLAFMIAVGFTFNYEYQSDAMLIATEEAIVMDDLNQNDFLLPASEIPDYFQKGIDFLNQNSTTIVLLWFLIFSIKCFGIFRSLSNIYRIRNYRNQEVPEYWTERVSELSQILKIKKKIVLLESQLVSVPSVTGFFKPIILIPIGLLSNLPQDQIEAILLHELAHIRRKDYFINLIQSFAEILFFFNPGVLWVSSIIKEERENCCDDIAVGITKSKSKFIHALVSFQEYNMKKNELAMGFGSKKNQLLERAKRIIHDNNKSLNSIEKTFLSICIIIIASFTVACSNTKAATLQNDEKISFGEEVVFENPSEQDGLTASEQAMIEAEVAEAEEIAKIESEAEIAQTEAEELQMEAEEAQREAEEAQMEAQINLEELENGVLSKEELKQIRLEVQQALKEAELARIEGLNAREIGRLARIEGEKARKEAIKAHLQGEEGRKIAEVARAEGAKARLEGEKARKEAMKAYLQGEEGRKVAAVARAEAAKARIAGEEARKAGELARIEGAKARLIGEKARLEGEKARIKGEKIRLENEQATSKIIEKLLEEKIISSSDNLSYKLTEKSFIVNGKEAPEKIRKELIGLLPKGITTAYYNYNVSKD